jgi:hypothetical protein
MWFSLVDLRNAPRRGDKGAEEGRQGSRGGETREPRRGDKGAEERGQGSRGAETREITGCKNGATELTKETDPLCERLSNSTRARFAREGGEDPPEHTSTLDRRACVFGGILPSLQPALRAGAASNSEPADRKIRFLRWLRCSVVEIRCLPCLQLLPLLASSSSPSLASSSSPSVASGSSPPN